MTHFLAVAALLCAMTDTVIDIEEVTITGHTARTVQTHTSLPSIQLSLDYLQQNFSGSLMQTLQGIPGVKAMSIGSGQSKPTIRGLGFNRMADADYGYVGAGPGKVNLYKGKTLVKRGVDEAVAPQELLKIIEEDRN